jgi:hypothetical protein
MAQNEAVRFLVEALERIDPRLTAESLLAQARDRGFDLEPEQVRAAIAEVARNKAAAGELDEAALAGVSGGVVDDRRTQRDQAKGEAMEQQINQLYSMLSSMLKAMNEQQSALIKNMR